MSTLGGEGAVVPRYTAAALVARLACARACGQRQKRKYSPWVAARRPAFWPFQPSHNRRNFQFVSKNYIGLFPSNGLQYA